MNIVLFIYVIGQSWVKKKKKPEVSPYEKKNRTIQHNYLQWYKTKKPFINCIKYNQYFLKRIDYFILF